MEFSSMDAAADASWPDDASWIGDDRFGDDRFVDEADFVLLGECPPAVRDVWADGSAHAAGVHALEDVTVRARVLIAEQYAGIAAVLADAAACPEPWVGPDPTLDPDWIDPRERTAGQVRAERRDIAVRAAAADIAVRLGLSDTMVRARATHAEALRRRCPLVWDAFRAGTIEERNAITTAQLALSLPHDAPAAWAAFDEAVVAAAGKLPPGKYRTRARAVRERAHPEPLDDRHARAAQERGVWLTAELDGMATLSIFGPAADIHAAYARVDAHARHLHDQPDETRTLTQLRTDVLTDLLTRGETDRSGKPAGRPAVAITIPVMTLLGHDDEPATLHGYGPIDTDTAKRLAGTAKSWARILTHPVTGTVLDVDRTTYRVPNDLKRWLGIRDPVCTRPGCTRLARDCDIDHRIEWQHGGTTSAENNGPLCEPDHILKTKSLWSLHRDPTTGATWWITPTALRVDPDPPPW